MWVPEIKPGFLLMKLVSISMKKVKVILLVLMSTISAVYVAKAFFFHPDVYPIKSSVFKWAGDTKISESSATINGEELESLRALLQPGDIFLNRSDYYISNIGIPGFWTHASLYIGIPEERERFFSEDIKCQNWVSMKGEKSGDLEHLLKNTYGSIYDLNNAKSEAYSIVESVSEGVVLSTFKEGAEKDGIVVLRPLLPKSEIAKAIFKAMDHINRPYDYNFDFSTDTVIACTELVYKVYEDSELFPVNEMFGKPFSTANEIAEYCDSNYNDPELKLALVYIYDGINGYLAKNDTAHQIFRNSWNESLW